MKLYIIIMNFHGSAKRAQRRLYFENLWAEFTADAERPLMRFSRTIGIKGSLFSVRAQEMCESRGGRSGLSVIILTVSVDVKQRRTMLRH